MVSTFCAPQTPTSPSDYQQAFAGLRTAGAEWAASDGSIPVVLPDGRVLWLYGDTLVGRVQPDGSIATGWKMVRNSFVIQDGACLTPMMGGTRGSRTEIIPNPASGEWFWPTAGAVETNDGTQVLRVFMLRLRANDDAEPFNFTVVGVEAATYSLPGLARLSITDLPLAAPDAPPYGQTVLVGTDGYLYLYGSQAVSCGCLFFDPYEHRIARAPLGNELTPSAWEFAHVASDGSGVTWSSSPTDATPMVFSSSDPGPATADGGPRAPLEVTPYGNGYLATAKTIDAFSDDISTWFAPTPTGPWSYVDEAVSGLPGDPTATFSYGGRIATNLPGSPLLIWSQNHEPLPDVIANNTLYEAKFATPAPGALP